MSRRASRLGAALAWLLCAAGQAAEAPSVPAPQGRDPTLPPASVRAAAAASAPAGSGPAPSTSSPASPAQHLMVVDGRPYLVERGWLRGVGDRWGEARIEKITAEAVWLREADGLRRYPLYPGVQVRPVTAQPARKAPQESTP